MIKVFQTAKQNYKIVKEHVVAFRGEAVPDIIPDSADMEVEE